MTSRHAFLACSICACVSLVTARVEAQSQPPQLGALRTPPSPAFAVMGIEPSAVERPTTPSDVGLTFINKFRDQTLPKNYAFEASPYWLVSRPNLQWRDDETRKVPQSIARTTSFSIATAETGTTAAPVTSLGFGARMLLASGQMTRAAFSALETLEKLLGQDGELVLTLMEDRGMATARKSFMDGVITAEELAARQQGILELVLASDEYKNAAKAGLDAMQDIAVRREGFFFEIAAGLVWDYANGRWESGAFRKRAVWATPSYEAGPWTALGVVRFVDDQVTPNEDAVDWGGRAIYSQATYAMSLEFVERAPVDVTSTVKRSHRLVGIAEYRVSPTTWVVASFGKDRRKAGTSDTLVAQLGLAFNFAHDRYKF